MQEIYFGVIDSEVIFKNLNPKSIVRAIVNAHANTTIFSPSRTYFDIEYQFDENGIPLFEIVFEDGQRFSSRKVEE